MSEPESCSKDRNRKFRFERRAARAFFSAGLEIGFALSFLLFSLLAFVIVDRQGLSIPLVTLEGKLTMHYWESEPDRLERTLSTLEQSLPRHSSFTASELDTHPKPEFSQTIVVKVVYRNLTGFFHWGGLSFDLATATGLHRGAMSGEIIRLSGPTYLVGAFAVQFALIPYLLLRFWWIPPCSIPAKPLIPQKTNFRRLMALCAAGGMSIGVAATAFFSAAHYLGLLTFSERMPTLEMMGITPELLWLAAIFLAIAGAVEEAFFRGLLLRRFTQNDLPTTGIVVCAFWFTLIHLSYFSWDSGNLAYALWIGAMGLGLGFLTVRMRSWTPAAILHAGYNFAVTLMAGAGSFAQG